MPFRRDAAIAVMFTALLAAPMLVHIIAIASAGRSATLEMENRLRAPFPRYSSEGGVVAFTSGLTAYLDDHFGLRGAFLGVHQAVEDELNLTSSSVAVVGREGWLFLAGDDLLQDAAGDAKINHDQLIGWMDGLARIDREAEAQRRTFALLIAPNKHSIYPEHLPPYVRAESGAQRLDGFLGMLRENAASYLVIDPRQALLAAKDGAGPLYFQTDTHWTGAGAFIAYQAFMQTLAEAGVVAPILDGSDLARRPVANFRGDLVGMLGTDRFDETRIVLDVAKPVASVETVIEREGAPKLQWPVVHEQDLPGAPTLTVSADSFIRALLPYLKQSFSRIVVVRRYPVIVHPRDLSVFETDIVLFQFVERMLSEPLVLQPFAPATSDGASVSTDL